MTHDTSNRFGDLRSLLQEESPSEDDFLSLIEREQELAPEVYRTQWVPYMLGHALPVIQAFSLDDLDLMVEYLPDNTSFSLSHAWNTHVEQWHQSKSLLHRVERLHISDIRGKEDEVILKLDGSPELLSLESLALSGCQFYDSSLRQLAHMRPLNALREFKLTQHDELLASGVEILAEQTAFPELQRLDLSHNEIDEQAVSRLCRGQALRSLTALSLQWCSFQSRPQHVFEHLAQTDAFPLLEELDMRFKTLHSSQEVLFESQSFPRLKKLALSYVWINKEIAMEMARGHFCAQLTHLFLPECTFEYGALEILANAPWASQLHTLDLSRTNITDHDAVALKDAALSNLRVLHLRSQKKASIIVNQLGNARLLEHLEELDLSGTTCDLFRHTIAVKHLPNLKRLSQSSFDHFHTSQIDSIPFELRAFHLCHAAIENAHLEQFLHGHVTARLTHLTLRLANYRYYKSIDILPALTRSQDTPWLLRHLDLGGIDMYARDVCKLVKSPLLNHVVTLDLSGTSLTKMLHKALSNRHHLPHLRRLRVDVPNRDMADDLEDFFTIEDSIR